MKKLSVLYIWISCNRGETHWRWTLRSSCSEEHPYGKEHCEAPEYYPNRRTTVKSAKEFMKTVGLEGESIKITKRFL